MKIIIFNWFGRVWFKEWRQVVGVILTALLLSILQPTAHAQVRDAVVSGFTYSHIKGSNIDPSRYTGYLIGLSHSDNLLPFLGYSGTLIILDQHADRLDIYGATGSFDINVYPFKPRLKAIAGIQIGMTNSSYNHDLLIYNLGMGYEFKAFDIIAKHGIIGSNTTPFGSMTQLTVGYRINSK